MIEITLSGVCLFFAILTGLWLFFGRTRRSWGRLERVYWTDQRPKGEGFFCKLFFDGPIFWEARFTQVLLCQDALYLKSMADGEMPLRILWTQITNLTREKKWDENLTVLKVAGYAKPIFLIAMGDEKVHDDLKVRWDNRFGHQEVRFRENTAPFEVIYL